MPEKIYLETFEKCPGSVCFSVLKTKLNIIPAKQICMF